MFTTEYNRSHCSNPTPTPEGPGGDDVIVWPQYEPELCNYVLLDNTPTVDIDYRQKQYAFYNYYLRNIIYGIDF